MRNYGFGDATEIFIFISGYANAHVYGAVIRRRGLIDAAAWILNRAWQIYLARIFLFVIYIAEIAYLAARRRNLARACRRRDSREGCRTARAG